ncbi:MAG: zinc-ribbon domain-containing protein [Clostridia bacterium]|nr:zinc-ribbon domain-containing protein [Clostridia bacterium]
MKCPFCGAQLEDGARFCVYCAKPTNEKKKVRVAGVKRGGRILPVVLAALLLSATVAVLAFAVSLRGREAPPQDGMTTASENTTGAPVTETEPDATAPESTPDDTDSAETTEADVTVSKSEPEQPATKADTTVPETTAPGTATQTTASDPTSPGTTVPVTAEPVTTAPATTEPETTAPDTAAPETVPPETTEEITTAPETEGEESSAQIQTPGIAIVSADTFAGGPPENEEEMLTKQYLFAELNHFGGWDEKIFGYDNPEIGSSVQLEDLVLPDRVYFSDDGNAVVTARLYTDGKDVDFRMLKYSVGMDQTDTSFEAHVRENSGMKRPAGWRGLAAESGIGVDPYSEDEMKKQFPEATGIRPVSYEYWVIYLNGTDRTVKVTIEKRVSKILPEGGYETSAWWYPDVTDWFTLAEYVN